jgi:methylmalonyl-CoA mutase C-terminal domain/subunit
VADGGGKIKVLMSKPGLDAHWRGIYVVSRALRDAGVEVVYGGNQTAAEIVETAIQEDVDVIGLSILAPGHLRLIGDVLDTMKERELTDRLVLVGGTIPREDIEPLKAAGVDEIFLPGTPLDDIAAYVKANGKCKRATA